MNLTSHRLAALVTSAVLVTGATCACTGSALDDAAPATASAPTPTTEDDAATTTPPSDPTTTSAPPEDAPVTVQAGDEAEVTEDAGATRDPDARATVLFTGDVSPARTIGPRIVADGPEVPWTGIADELAAADLRVTNLETTVGTAGVAEGKRFPFQAPAEVVESLAVGGFELATLANNHTYDYGPEGLLETLRLVHEGGIATVGAGADDTEAHTPWITEVEGVELAFLGYLQITTERNGYTYRHWPAGPDRPGVAWADPELIARDVAAVADEVDHVVVLLHSGWEYGREVNEYQIAAAGAAFAGGASAVIGHHPHVLQGWSLEEDRLTAWSLGNTVFTGFADPDTMRTALLNVTFTPDRIEDVEWIPATIDAEGFPHAVDPEGETGRSILAELDSLPVPDRP